MKLIDADALNVALGAHYDKGEGMSRFQCAALLDAAPTVCCKECEYRKADTCYCELIGMWFVRDFGCSHFERRQP